MAAFFKAFPQLEPPKLAGWSRWRTQRRPPTRPDPVAVLGERLV